jgi:hypothetical protein
MNDNMRKLETMYTKEREITKVHLRSIKHVKYTRKKEKYADIVKKNFNSLYMLTIRLYIHARYI